MKTVQSSEMQVRPGKTLRTALRALLQNSKDNRMVGRLASKMVEVIQADAINPRGQRNVVDGEAELMEDFDFGTQKMSQI
jgi:hypothetical protein